MKSSSALIMLAALLLIITSGQASAQELSASLDEDAANAPTEIEKDFANADVSDGVVPESTVSSGEIKFQDSGFAKTRSYSEFFFLPAHGENSAQFNYRTKSAPRSTPSDSSVNSNSHAVETQSNAVDYDLHYVRSVTATTYLSFDLGYETQTTTGQDYNLRSSGLKDVEIGLTNIGRYGSWNLVYGALFGIAPGQAVQANNAGIQGNRFSGGYSIDPFIGFETTSHTAAWGARASAHEASDGTNQSYGFNQPEQTLGASAFYEVPVLPTARIGFTAGAFHDGLSTRALQSVFNDFSAGVYSRISLRYQADILLGLQAQTHDENASSMTETDATIGLRKTL